MRVSYVYLLGPKYQEDDHNLDVQIFTRTEQESSTSYFTGMEYCMGNRLNTMKMQSKQVHDCLYALKLTLNIIVNKAASQQKYELLLGAVYSFPQFSSRSAFSRGKSSHDDMISSNSPDIILLTSLRIEGPLKMVS